MKLGISQRVGLSLLVLILLVVAGWLTKTAYEHRGFFAYKYSILTSKKYAAYQDTLIDLVKEDPKQAFITFREILATDPFSYNSCHGIAHQMGHVAYETFGFQTAMSYQDALCGAGYIHGIVEARFGALQEKEIFSQVATICDEGNKSCYHGIGHGLMVATKLNISQSLAFCDGLPALGRRNCYDGVWMHIFDLEESGAPHDVGDATALPDSVVVEQRRLLCETTQDEYKTSCYFYLPRIYAHAYEAPFQTVVSLCNKVEKDFNVVCAAGVGHMSMKYHVGDPMAAINMCGGFSTAELSSACKEGGFLYYLFSAEAVEDSTSVCDSFFQAQDQKMCRKVDQYRGDL